VRHDKESLDAMIGKTRHNPPTEIEELFDPEVGRARGILRRPLPAGKLRHVRRRPARDLTDWIAHYWMIHWDLRGCEPHVAETPPQPNIHAVFQDGGSVVRGVHTSKFSRLLKGRAQVFGIKFRPGGIRPFLAGPASSLANRNIPVRQIFGKDVDALEAILVSSAKEPEKMAAANAFFSARRPEPDKTIALAGQLVGQILENADIKTVNDLASRTGISKRTIQRIFNEYVGVSPKWAIRHYRLHEALERINCGDYQEWAQLALELGHFDQAHLINDFKSIVGYSPVGYQKLIDKHT
jgi:AraC-like DNA-binding protein